MQSIKNITKKLLETSRYVKLNLKNIANLRKSIMTVQNKDWLAAPITI